MPTLAPRPSTEPATAAARRSRSARRWWTVALAVVVALLLQAGLIVLLAWALPHWPRRPVRHGSAAPISLTVQSAEPSPTPAGLHKTETVPQQPEYMRTPDDRASDTPPPDPNFISDKDTLAASEKPSEDPSKPLPTQDGKAISAFDFDTNPYIPGKEAHDNLLTASAPAASQPAPTPPPVNPTPTPAPSPTPTPPPEKPGDFSLARSEPSPSNTPPEPTPRSRPDSTPPVRDLLAAQAARVARENPAVSSSGVRQPPGYQPQTIQTKMSGSVNNRGKASVAALGTPLGRYEKAVSDAISARWYFLLDERMSSLVRTSQVEIHFVVTRQGKIINTHVGGKDPNTAFASVSLEAVANAEVPPIPPDVASLLPGGQLDVDYTFGFFEE